MNKIWLSKLMAALLVAALLISSMAVMAEESVKEAGEVELPEVYEEIEVELGAPEDGEGNTDVNSGTLWISPTSMTINVGDSKQATVTFTEPVGTVYWKSSNESVATCTWGSGWYGDDTYLTVNGNKAGTATITITNDQNSDRCTLNVTVKGSGGTGVGTYSGRNKKDGKQTCRALLIGEEAFSPICTRNRGDVTLMQKMLKSVKGPKGKSWTITSKYDRTNSQVKSDIYAAFKKADKDDLSLFFIATHGDTDSSGSYAGALAMIPSGFMLMSELAAALKEVPGQVIIVVESCGSGAGVFSTYGEQNANAVRNAAKAFDQAVIDAFAAADPGIEVTSNSVTSTKGAAANTGELRIKNKFYVLTASRYQELSWGTESGPYNFFTKWLTDGIGTSGKMKADTNNNKKVTVKELFKYISKVGDNYGFYSDGRYYYQHVQAYPKNSGFVLFKR
jgi:hypothetical protein